MMKVLPSGDTTCKHKLKEERSSLLRRRPYISFNTLLGGVELQTQSNPNHCDVLMLQMRFHFAWMNHPGVDSICQWWPAKFICIDLVPRDKISAACCIYFEPQASNGNYKRVLVCGVTAFPNFDNSGYVSRALIFLMPWEWAQMYCTILTTFK